MNKTCFRVSLFVIILMLPWTAVYAAGLGKLTLNSALGQPLNAEIDIVTTSRDEVPSLKASIATREAFAQAGINYESFFSALKISIESRTNGNPYIKVTSSQAVNEPFLNLLMELNWASGRILREYTVLLDPVAVNTQEIVAPDVNAASAAIATKSDTERRLDIKKDTQGKNSSKSVNRSGNQNKDIYGPVNRGDTLSSIARQFLPAGVDLNQMLVALYRANNDAFIANNMNLLKAGAVLKIPEKSEIAAIEPSVARAEIRVQVKDWHHYQGKVAAVSSESQAQSNIRQSDQGQITTTIDKKSAATHGAPKEVLKLSSGSQLTDKNAQSESAMADRLRMMEEDAIARNLALKEANERVAVLEKSIDNLKKLLELKDSVLAQAQSKAESSSKGSAKPEARPAEIISAPPEKDAKLDTNSVPMQESVESVATQSANAISIQEADVDSLPPEEAEDQSLTDQIFNNIEYIGAGLILILLSALLILKRRRNQLEENADEDEIKSADFSSAIRSRISSMAAAPTAAEANQSFSAHEDDDLSYNNLNTFSETEKEDDEFNKGSTTYKHSTEYIAESKSDPESTSGTQPISDSRINDLDLNDQAIDLNLEEDFDRDQSSADFSNEDAFDLAAEIEQNSSAKDDVQESIKSSDDSESVPRDRDASDYALAIDFESVKQTSDLTHTEETAGKQDESNLVEFEFDDSEVDLSKNEVIDEIKIPELETESKSTPLDEPLPFDQHPVASSDKTKSESVSDIPELGLADINLDIEDSSATDQKEELNPQDKSEQWQEIETKLDLAKAYQEMDDKEGAKEMLEEVIRDGDAKQKKTARKLMKSLS